MLRVMLQKILKVMEEGRRITLEELAEECGTTPAMLSAMMENLVRQGRLKKGSLSAAGSGEGSSCDDDSEAGHSCDVHSSAGKTTCRGCAGGCGCCETESIMDFFELADAESEI